MMRCYSGPLAIAPGVLLLNDTIPTLFALILSCTSIHSVAPGFCDALLFWPTCIPGVHDAQRYTGSLAGAPGVVFGVVLFPLCLPLYNHGLLVFIGLRLVSVMRCYSSKHA